MKFVLPLEMLNNGGMVHRLSVIKNGFSKTRADPRKCSSKIVLKHLGSNFAKFENYLIICLGKAPTGESVDTTQKLFLLNFPLLDIYSTSSLMKENLLKLLSPIKMNKDLMRLLRHQLQLFLLLKMS